MQTHCEAVTRRIDRFDSLFQVLAAKAQHMQYGPKDLALQYVDAVDLDQGRREKCSVAGGRRQFAAMQDFRLDLHPFAVRAQ